MTLPSIDFGAAHTRVTRVGLGGEGVLRTVSKQTEARAVIQEALDQGITYFDSAKAYADSELYLGSVWKASSLARSKIFQTSKSAARTKAGAMRDLQETLKRLHTDYLDLWQIHDVRTHDEIETIDGPGGALEAFQEAKASGRVRYIGVTGHHDPQVLTRAVREWPVDSVLMPVNPVEGVLGGFLTETLRAAQKKSIAVIAMKVFGGRHYINPDAGITAELLLRYSLSQDITLAIAGCSTPREVRALAAVGRAPKPLSATRIEELLKVFQPVAERLAFYRKENQE
jgi:aryl-alcohol dehydrogenase-like predicted oxidoreductase